MKNKVSKMQAKKIAKIILGFIPQEMEENDWQYMFYSGVFSIAIFKNIESQENSNEYKIVEYYDNEREKSINYKGQIINIHVYIQNECEKEIKLKTEDLQLISFEYNNEIEL